MIPIGLRQAEDYIALEIGMMGGGVPTSTYFGDFNIFEFQLRPYFISESHFGVEVLRSMPATTTTNANDETAPSNVVTPTVAVESIVFLLDDGEVTANRQAMEKASDYFQAMFSGRFSEGRDASDNKPLCVKIQDIPANIFRHVVRFASQHYYRPVEGEEDVALELIAASDRFCMPRLKLCLESYLSAKLDDDNVEGLMSFALQAECDVLSFLARSFKRRRRLEVIASETERKSNTTPCCNLESCRVTVGLMKCSACKKVWYCSKECQKKDRKRHKVECRVIAIDIGSTASAASTTAGAGAYLRGHPPR